MSPNSEVLNDLKTTLPASAIIYDTNDKHPYENGFRFGQGKAAMVLRPSSIDELRRATRICFKHSISTIPQGANTGLVGASTPDGAGTQIVMSLERLKGEIQINKSDRCVTVAAGVLLSELNSALESEGLFFPIDLGADPTIGGMIATNTGGARMCRYGDVRSNVMGLEAILIDENATVVDLLSRVRKDNSAPDLKHLFIGTGGAIGIITKAVLNLAYLPKQQTSAFLVPTDALQLDTLMTSLEICFGESLSAMELISGKAIELALVHQSSLIAPFQQNHIPDEVILLELSSTFTPNFLDLSTLIENGLTDIFERGLIEDAYIARGNEFWDIRHALSEGLKNAGQVIAFDVSIPRHSITAFRQLAKDLVLRILPAAMIADFGHITDGGLHYNLVISHDKICSTLDTQIIELRTEIYDLVVRNFGGSFSAEHGLGPYNWSFYLRYRKPELQMLDQQISRVFGLGAHARISFEKI